MRFVSALVAVLAVGARSIGAQAPGSVRGLVYDSVARAPLAGALVQLQPTDDASRPARSITSDSLGRFVLEAVSPGAYVLGFLHPMLDSVGVAPPMRAVRVESGRESRTNLAIPSPSTLRGAFCPNVTGGAVAGVVRDAVGGAAVPGATVIAQWIEYTFTPGGVSGHTPQRRAVTRDNGWFVICDVPSTGSVAMLATRGADSTSIVELDVPDGGFLRRDLYIAPAQYGTGTITGSVVRGADQSPVAGARVSVGDGAPVRTDAQGAFTLRGVPLGTRALDVRAIGYFPEHHPVNVVANTASVRVELPAMAAMLDTIRINASRARIKNNGFEERSRSGTGKYITPEDVARWRPFRTSDLFRLAPSLRVDRGDLGDGVLTMRASGGGRCLPAVYIDGGFMPELSADDIDTWVDPEEIAGMEIYSGAYVPPQFSHGLGGSGRSAAEAQGCGSIVIWTRANPVRIRNSWRTRLVYLGAISALIALLSKGFRG